MSPQPPADSRDARVETLFHGALERSEAERRTWLRREAAGDVSLVREVEELLGALGEAPSCLERPAWGLGRELDARASEVSPVGSRIGPYVVERLLGEGGMGEVWLARQTRPVARRVALKRIKLGMDTQEVVRRFASERKAVARLSHPNIAAVYDAGVTPRGRPYFAMEYVPGERITEACDRRRLGLVERLELFVQVCDAVQHAHQHGIIHRDLKPSNVLVMREDGQLVPKVIDFGVAKATQGGRGRRTVATRNGQLIGTPGYMSPEQARAGDVDTRTDVYALGVLLYELVAGVQPHDPATWRGLGDEQLQRLVARLEPPRPSTRLAELGPVRLRALALRRRVEPRTLLRKLRGDLDWISMRALELDRERRYASVSELAADVVAHLRDEPVSAGPPSALYRLRKAAVRHRRPVLAAGMALASLGAGSVALLGWLASSRESLRSDLAQVSVALDSSQQSEAAARADRDALVAACDAAALHAGESDAYTTLLVRNGTGVTLQPGMLVEFAGRAEEGPGGPSIRVVPARQGSGQVVFGVVTSGAERAGDHVHRADGPLAPGGLGHVAVSGTLVPVAVVGPVQPSDVLAPSGIAGLAARHSDQAERLGRALEAHDGDGFGTVMVQLSIGAVPRPQGGVAASSLAWLPSTPRPVVGDSGDGGEAPPTSDAGGAQDRGEPGQSQAESLLAAGVGALTLPAAQTPGSAVGPELVGGSITKGGSGPSTSVHGIGSSGNLGLSGAGWFPGQAPAAGPQGPAGGGGSLGGLSGDSFTGGGGRGDMTGGTPPLGNGAGDGEPDLGVALVDGHAEGLGGQSDSDGGGGGDGQAEPRWADIDGDGLLDVLVPAQQGVVVLRNAGQGLFEDLSGRSNLDALGAVSRLELLDLDGDELLDVAALADGRVRLLRGDGRGAWRDMGLGCTGLATLPALVELGVVDLERDGRPDLRVAGADGSLHALLNLGLGRFRAVLVHAPPSPPEAADEEPVAPAPGDVGPGPDDVGPGPGAGGPASPKGAPW